MGEPIKIVVTAETAAAAAALQTFLKQTDSGLKEAAKTAGHSAEAFTSNRIAMLELGHVGRATAEGLAAGIDPLRMLALESPRILQALSMMGVGLAATRLMRRLRRRRSPQVMSAGKFTWAAWKTRPRPMKNWSSRWKKFRRCWIK